jgi:hypothetical protein
MKTLDNCFTRLLKIFKENSPCQVCMALYIDLMCDDDDVHSDLKSSPNPETIKQKTKPHIHTHKSRKHFKKSQIKRIKTSSTYRRAFIIEKNN